MANSIYDDQIEEEIPGTFYIFSLINSEEYKETNPVLSEPDEYDIPESSLRGKPSSGGLCAYALLNVLKENGNGASSTISWGGALDVMQEEIQNERGYKTYVPMLSTSRPIAVRDQPMQIASSSRRGVKRALLIGIHYIAHYDEDAMLSSCQDDVRKIREYLIHEAGFQKNNVLVVMDDGGRHHEPSKQFILDCLKRLCAISKPGDTIFVHFSGHGGRVLNDEEYAEDENTIPHELLAPSDYHQQGVIEDDEFYASFIRLVPSGVHVMAVIDTCHPSPSSCALELPYVCIAGEDEVHDAGGFRSGRAIIASAVAAAKAAVLAAKIEKERQERERQEQERREQERQEKERQEKEREAKEREEREREEREREEMEKKQLDKKKNTKKEEKSDKKKKKKKKEDDDDDGSSGSEKLKSDKKSKKKKNKKSKDESDDDGDDEEEAKKDKKKKKKKKK